MSTLFRRPIRGLRRRTWIRRRTDSVDGEEGGTAEEPGRYPDGHNRGLICKSVETGGKSWLFRFERDGRERWHGLGPAYTFSLKEARERARAARQLLADGIDPIDHRKAERSKLAAAKAKLLIFREATEALLRSARGQMEERQAPSTVH